MKIIIWGTGNGAKKLLPLMKDDVKILGFIETVPKRESFEGLPVYSPTNIPSEYDYIFVASTYATEILKSAEAAGIEQSKMCFNHLPVVFPVDKEENLDRASNILYDSGLSRIEGYSESAKHCFVNRDLEEYCAKNTKKQFEYQDRYKYFISYDKYEEAGELDYYFWQDLWGAKLVKEHNPEKHYDIGSRIDGFIGHLLSFRDNVFMIDIREMTSSIPGLSFVQGDATNLDSIEDSSLESISSLCAIEHFGLGRYGDPIDPDACFKALDSIQRKLIPGGYAYIAVPIGSEHVEFNAHRVFYPETIVKSMNLCELVRFDVTDGKGIEYNVDIHKYDDSINYKKPLDGLFCFRKK